MHTAASSLLFSDKKMRLLKEDEDGDNQENNSNNKIIINEDFMEEIFLRLPLKSLHRCKSLSKTSRCLISSACFLRRYLVTRSIDMSSLMLGFFYQPFLFSCEADGTVIRPPIKFIPCSSVGEKLMMNEVDHQKACGVLPFDESLSFLLLEEPKNYCEYNDIMKSVYIEASSNGFLLCRREPEFGEFHFHYYVCNPITKQWVSLPRPPNPYLYCVEGFICEGSNMYPCLDSVTYNVVRVLLPQTDFFDPFLIVELFSSETGEWVEWFLNTGSSNQTVKVIWPEKLAIGKRGTVCVAAKIKESLSEYAITFNINGSSEQEVQIIALPGDGYSTDYQWDQSEGFIRVIRYKDKIYEIWQFIEENNCETKWLLKHTINIRELFPGVRRKFCHIEALHPLNSALVLINLHGQKKVLLDVNNKSLKLISEFATRHLEHYFYPYYWPCWPPLAV